VNYEKNKSGLFYETLCIIGGRDYFD